MGTIEFTGWLASIAYPLGNGAQGVGMVLVARYVYAFLFRDEFDPSEQVVRHAKAGFMLLVAGFCLVHLFSLFSSLAVLYGRFVGGEW